MVTLSRDVHGQIQRLDHAEGRLKDALSAAGVKRDDLALAVRHGYLNRIKVGRTFRELTGVDDEVRAIRRAAPELFPPGWS